MIILALCFFFACFCLFVGGAGGGVVCVHLKLIRSYLCISISHAALVIFICSFFHIICILISYVVVLQGVETDLQKKSHTMDKLQHEGQALKDSVDSGKEDIDSLAKAVKERWDKVNDGQLRLCSPFCAAECCCVAVALPLDVPPKLVLRGCLCFLNKVLLCRIPSEGFSVCCCD